MTALLMKNVKPFYARATVAASPVDEAEHESGLIVPIQYSGADEFKRGVLLDVHNEPPHLGAELLERGMVVYYRKGVSIGDVIVVELRDILAYEDPE